MEGKEMMCPSKTTNAGTSGITGLPPHGIRLLVALLALLSYANSSWGGFVFDDSEAILGNQDVDPSTSVWEVFGHDFWGEDILSNASHKSYRPLTVLTFRWNHWLAGGLEPAGFHMVNVILHTVVSLLYLEICSMICRKSDLGSRKAITTAAVAALLFAVHPIHTESVAGIVGRAELMSASCFFLTILCYGRACDDDSNWRKVVSWLMLAVLLVGCALLFKEQGITAVGVCVVYDILLQMRADPKDVLRFKLATDKKSSHLRSGIRMSVILFAAMTMSLARLSTGSPTFKPIDNAASFADSLLSRVLSYNYIYSLNAWLLLNPWWLCFDWSMGCVPLLNSIGDFRLIAVAAFWIASGVLIYHCLMARNDPMKKVVTLSLAMVVIPFLPATNIFIRVGFVIAERVLYLPSAGYCLLVAVGVTKISRLLNRGVWAGVVFVVVIFTTRSITRSSQWLSEERLFKSGYTVCPNNAKVLYNIGKVVSDGGDAMMGEVAYREAIRLNPEYDQALNNLGNILKDHGDPAEAEQLFHRALNANQKYPAAWMNLGIVQVALGKYQEAEESYRKAIKQRKKYPDAYYNLGNLYKDLGQHQEAVSAYKDAIGLKRDHTSAWNNYGLLYEELKLYKEAEEVMRMAISEVPNYAQFYSSLGIMLGRQNRLEEGQELLEKAVALVPNSGNYLANLGVVYHLQKDYEKAEEAYSLALKLQPDLSLARENFNKLLSSRMMQTSNTAS